MGLLRVNPTLATINLDDTSWEKDGKEALIEEALKRNRKLVSYFSAFREAELKFEGAKAGRLFLCGSPMAGKTKLKQTMMRIVQGRTWLGDKMAQLLTTGIEMEMLKADPDMQIAVWDFLAGQSIFRALQSVLFPQTHHNCVFLFVFSPFDEERGHLKHDLDSCFRTELEEWLQFIASSSQATGHTLPHVLVVVTHMDRMEHRDVTWAKTIVDKLRNDFEGVLDLHSSESMYSVNAKRKEEVKPLTSHIFRIFQKLLLEDSLIAPPECSLLTSVLPKSKSSFKSSPVIPSSQFYSFCSAQVKSLHAFDTNTETGLRLFQAITSYLHDVGTIVQIPLVDLIVVDPNWLTHVFLGELISLGHNFQKDKTSLPISTRFYSETGIVGRSDFDSMLLTFLRENPRFENLSLHILKHLLRSLDLCYELEDSAGNCSYFIPTLVSPSKNEMVDSESTLSSPNHSRSALHWRSSCEADSKFVGYRLRCLDKQRMCLTSAFFSRFQVYFRHKLVFTQRRITEGDVRWGRSYIQICMEGHEIVVEVSDAGESHVDILVKGSELQVKDMVRKYVMENVVNEIRTFCASPQGCPGVSLALAILQTSCVKNLFSWHLRKDFHTIGVEELMKRFQNHINERLANIEHDGVLPPDEKTLLNYEHQWPAVQDGDLMVQKPMFELAKDLLLQSEVERIVREIERIHIARLDQLRQAFSRH
ncbi:hypothetical protein Mapa_011858 [Marchantia paleacea]|nr:hypothetical protein Mapa_011858 [Marchantia paleacea]